MSVVWSTIEELCSLTVVLGTLEEWCPLSIVLGALEEWCPLSICLDEFRLDELILEFGLQRFASRCLLWFFLFGSHEPFILSGRRVPRRGISVRSDVARPRLDQPFFGSHFFGEFLVFPVLFRCNLGLGNKAFRIFAIIEAINSGMETAAHFSAARPVNSVAKILVASKNFVVFFPI